jgi:hypothetical protein
VVFFFSSSWIRLLSLYRHPSFPWSSKAICGAASIFFTGWVTSPAQTPNLDDQTLASFAGFYGSWWAFTATVLVIGLTKSPPYIAPSGNPLLPVALQWLCGGKMAGPCSRSLSSVECKIYLHIPIHSCGTLAQGKLYLLPLSFIASLTWFSTQLFHMKLFMYRGQSGQFSYALSLFSYHSLPCSLSLLLQYNLNNWRNIIDIFFSLLRMRHIDLFQFRIISEIMNHWHTVGLLGRVISSLQGLYLHRTIQHRWGQTFMP